MTEYVVEFGKDGRPSEADGRLDAAAFHRNAEPIWAVLAARLAGQSGDALEVGSGTGQHVVRFARDSPGIRWWPSDLNEQHLKSIAAWRAHSMLPNVLAPRRLDMADPGWWTGLQGQGPRELIALFCANVVHIAPWKVAEGLFVGAGQALGAGGRVFLYGPFMRDGRHTAPSNAAFDASLRQANPEWGVRDIAELDKLATGSSLALLETVDMPANNMMLVFGRLGSPAPRGP